MIELDKTHAARTLTPKTYRDQQIYLGGRDSTGLQRGDHCHDFADSSDSGAEATSLTALRRARWSVFESPFPGDSHDTSMFS